MVPKKILRQFLLPPITRTFLIRISIVALASYLVFGHLCLPIRIQGSSMEPTYHDGAVNFCWTLGFFFSKPGRHDVVAIRFAGHRVMLLKRVVALEGERVEFQNGKLLIDGTVLDEPYVRYPCHWNLPPRQVEKDCLYVVGDNRNMPIEYHYFGQAPVNRVVGTPLW